MGRRSVGWHIVSHGFNRAAPRRGCSKLAAILGPTDPQCLGRGSVPARVIDILDNLDHFFANPIPMILTRAGFSIHGGLCFGVVAGMILVKRRSIPVIPMLDAAGKASLSRLQRSSKTFTFSGKPHSRCAGNRDHDRTEEAADQHSHRTHDPIRDSNTAVRIAAWRAAALRLRDPRRSGAPRAPNPRWNSCTEYR
jgi:hypothetical protein